MILQRFIYSIVILALFSSASRVKAEEEALKMLSEPIQMPDPLPPPPPPVNDRAKSSAQAAAAAAMGAAMAGVACAMGLMAANKEKDPEEKRKKRAQALQQCAQAAQAAMAQQKNDDNRKQLTNQENPKVNPLKPKAMGIPKPAGDDMDLLNLANATKRSSINGEEVILAEDEETPTGGDAELPEVGTGGNTYEEQAEGVVAASSEMVTGLSPIEQVKLKNEESAKGISTGSETPLLGMSSSTTNKNSNPDDLKKLTALQASLGEYGKAATGKEGLPIDGNSAGGGGGEEKDSASSMLDSMLSQLLGGMGPSQGPALGEGPDIIFLPKQKDKLSGGANIFEYASYRFRGMRQKDGKLKPLEFKPKKTVAAHERPVENAPRNIAEAQRISK